MPTFIDNHCIHQLFDRQAIKTPDLVAVTCGKRSLTYGELNSKSDQLADRLIGLGAKPDMLIGICAQRSLEMIIGILGILKAGSAYIPLDPEYPKDRLAYMLKDSGVSILLNTDYTESRLPDTSTFKFNLDSQKELFEKISSVPVKYPASPDNYIYTIYTSGSTGKPKGTLVYHRGFSNLMDWYTSEFAFSSGSHVLLMTSTSFDLTQKNIFAPLVQGGHLVLLNSEVFDAGMIQDTIVEHNITSVNCTPSAFYGIIAQGNESIYKKIASLKHVFLGGEPIIVSRLGEWRNNPFCKAEVINSYGPTECTDVCAYYRLRDYERYAESSVPIGRPICNTALYILDQALAALQEGEEGELCISGAGVGGGYLNRPELTAEKFIPNPFSENKSDLLYKTGDRARYLPDGTIEYLGRIDQQVKIRGFRIELGEIEARLDEHSSVGESVVIGRSDNTGENRLIAYLVPAKSSKIIVSDIRSFLQRKLPDYMLPTAWVFLDEIPLTPNGKIDRNALPEPQKKRPAISQTYCPPQTELEKLLAVIWQEILGFPQIGVDDPFFELGGTSIQAIQFIAHAGQILHQTIPIVFFFDAPTISRFAKLLLERYPDAVQSLTSATADVPLVSFRPKPDIGSQISINDFQANSSDDIAIIGMSGRFPGAENIEDFLKLLQDGTEAGALVYEQDLLRAGLDPALLKDPAYVARCFPLGDVEGFDAAFFGYSPKEVEIMDPQHRLFLENAWTVMEDAGYNLKNCDAKVGIFGGVAQNGYFVHNICSHPELREVSGQYHSMLGNEKDFPVTRAAYKLGLTGPAVNIQTACSSSGVAVHMASLSLNSGDCDMAIVGGCRVLVPHHTGYIHVDGGTLSADGHLRAFDKNATGMVRGSGGGCILLKRLKNAINDGDNIYAVIKSSAINNDGSNKAGFTAPGIQGQEEVVIKALAMAGVEAESIQYIETHGTGTRLGDPIEITALSQAFAKFTDKKQFCAIGSVKGNIGHLDAGACVSGIIKTVLFLKSHKLPPSINFESPNPAIDFQNSPFFVNTSLRDWPRGEQPRRAGISSFGLGGTNAHIIVEEAPERAQVSASRSKQLIMLSAKTKTALRVYAHDLSRFLQKNDKIDLADLAYTLQVGREDFQNRLFLVVQDSNEAARKLRKMAENFSEHHVTQGGSPQIFFMFPGQGSQHINMGRDLYETETEFKKSVNQCSDMLTEYIGIDLRKIIFPVVADEETAKKQLIQTKYAQPALFVIEYALAKLWLSWGIKPAGMIGHSIGEYTAACLAGVFALEDALATVAMRGRLMYEQPKGDMLAVSCRESDLESYIAGNVSLAAVNSPGRCVLSGPSEELGRTKKQLEKNGHNTVLLHTSHAFHSQMMAPALSPFVKHFDSIKLYSPDIPFISGSSGTWITDEQATSVEYWVQQLRNPIHFSQGITKILQKSSNDVLLEVGPSNALSVLARQHTDKAGRKKIITSWDHATKEHSSLVCTLSALGRLWYENADIQWRQFYRDESRRRISLPTYPFERKRYWIDPIPYHTCTQQNSFSQAAGKTILPQQSNIALQTQLQEKTSKEAHNLSRKANIAAELRQLFTELSGIEFKETDDTSSFLTLGLDSLFLTQVIGKLKKIFGVNLKFRQLLEEYIDISSLTDFLEQEIPKELFQPEAAPETSQLQDMGTLNVAAQPLHLSVNVDKSLEQIIAGQLHIMQQQLSMLRATPPGSTNIGDKKDNTRQTQPSLPAKQASLKATSAAKPFGAAARINKEKQGDLSAQQQKFIDILSQKYLKKTGGSKEYTVVHRSHLADPRVVSGFNLQIKELVYPIVVNRSRGSKVWDVDNNEYIDMTNAFGANLLGHSPDFITQAVQEQLHRGVEIGPQHPLSGEVAELICEFARQDRVVFCNTGSEAVLGAMRISRTVTGRDKIVVFTDDYHGMFDEVIVRASPSFKSVPAAAGIPAASVENILVLEYGADQSLDIIREQAEDIAAILVEPVQSRNLDLQPRAFLQELARVTKNKEIVLIFDEIVTGFRSHLYGAQAYFDVEADIVTYGKIVGGGMPIGVIAGKSQYMDALDGGMWQYGDDSVPEVGVTYFAGTFVRHPLALAAAKATLEYLKKCGPQLQENLNAKTKNFVAELRSFFDSTKAPIRLLHFSSAFQFVFTSEGIGSSFFFPLLRDKGVHIFPGRTWFFTTAHEDTDFAIVMKAVKDTITELQAEGFISGTSAKDQEDLENTNQTAIKLLNIPPIPGARMGKCPDGTPAWFAPDPDRPGKYLQLEIQ
jgi:amino acid adenylation domain-containing protein